VAALQGGALVVHFTNRKNAPLLFSTRLGTRPWKKPYAEFDEIVRSRRGRSLVELMQEAPKEEEDWVSEEFQKAVADNLKYH
jgi:hypothetical protein